MAAEDASMMEKKLRLLETDRKAYFENSQQQLKANKEMVKNLRKENKELKQSLGALSKSIGGVNDQAIQDNEIAKLDEKIIKLRKRYDDSKQTAESKKMELTRMKEKLKDLEKESAPILTDESPLTRKIRMLENRLDKSMIKYNEAQSIRKTYEQIVKRLKEERIGFDNQLAAIERTLKAKDHDYQELLNMSHDANHAKEIAKAELAQFRAAYEEERRQKDKELTERKQYVQSRIDQTQKLEKREKLRRTQELESLQRAEEEKQKAGGNQFDQSITQQRSEEEQEKLNQYEEAFRKIKEATGVSDVQEVIQKFITQEDTHRSLVEMTKEAETKIDQLNAEKNELKSKVEELKYSGSGQLGSRRIVDEFETHLTEAQHQCDKNRQKYERVAKIVINVKAGIEHLYDKLSIFKSDMQQMSMSDETVVDILKQCESKLMLLMEEAMPPGGASAGLEDLGMSNMELPPNNRRIKLPTSEDEGDEELEDEEEEEEDVLDRETVKKLASIAVARETKKLKKRKGKGKE
uniref:ODAD1 central coiled coil region domain-containing protein n=1 Tax=Eutreptiella gymnastica TaxID=73025 RepID=A0A7S1NA18_9EUGL|mmetsp:Transcript_140608/g.244807  ORF Transcript_140608/g.244807 Transcript_140608/m.244807 type:complete len:522 (+) Transcript_140608:101-1666(+)